MMKSPISTHIFSILGAACVFFSACSLESVKSDPNGQNTAPPPGNATKPAVDAPVPPGVNGGGSNPPGNLPPGGQAPPVVSPPPVTTPVAPIAGELAVQNLNDSRVLAIWNLPAAQTRSPHELTFYADSNTDNPYSMVTFTNVQAAQNAFGSDAALVNAIKSFSEASFAQATNQRTSRGSNRTAHVLQFLPGDINAGNRPRIALLLIGTGDHQCFDTSDTACPGAPNFPQEPASFEGRLNKILDLTISNGVLPVLFTKTDDLSPAGERINDKIREIANARGLPWADLATLIRTTFPNGTWSPENPAIHYTLEAHSLRNKAITQVLRQLCAKLNISPAR